MATNQPQNKGPARPPSDEVNLTESPISLKKKEERLEVGEPVKKKGRTHKVRVIATRMGFYGPEVGGMRIRTGTPFDYEAELDSENRPILPTWVVLEKDYVPEAEPSLPPGMHKVRGGATQGGLKL